jgi:hypothetical protein
MRFSIPGKFRRLCVFVYCFYTEILALLTQCSEVENENADEAKHIMKLVFITVIFKCFSGMYKLKYSQRII